MAHENNDTPNPFIDPLFAFAQGSDSDGVPYSEYDFMPAVIDDGYYYICTLVDTRDNTVAHIAVVGRDRPEACGTYVKHTTLRHGLFIHRVPVPQEEVSWVGCFADHRNQYKLTKAIIDADRPSLDFDGDDPIVRADTLRQLILEISHSSREVQLETLEKWVSDNGGLYNALRRLVVLKPIELDEIPQYVVPEYDALGMRCDHYVKDRPELQEGDSWVGRSPGIDKHELTVVHLAKVVGGKVDPVGTLVTYTCDRLGNFLTRNLVPPEALGSLGGVFELGEIKDPRLGSFLADYEKKHGGTVHAINSPTEASVTKEALALLEDFGQGKMTLDDAVVISACTSPEEQAKALGKWLSPGSRMDNILEDNLSNALFGPAPGSKERVRDTDLETAKRLCTDVVRLNKNGRKINYGRLAVGHLEGLPFLGRVEFLEQLGVRCLYISKVPQFIQDICLTVSWGRERWVEGELLSNLAVVSVWALEKEDIAALGLALSKNDRRVVTGHKDRYLQEWVNGVCTQPHQTIDAFLPDQTDEDIENSRY